MCPHSDRVKYQGLGGVVLATAVLAVLSGSYAFYTVFVPKQDLALSPVQQAFDPPTLAVAILFGCIWGLVIFNLDRFVVSSAGKGDGEETISFAEFRSALPRMLLAVAIAVTISKPLEIRVMESEIEAQLELEQQEYRAQLDDKTEQRFSSRKAEMLGLIDEGNAQIDKIRDYLEQRRLEIQAQRRLLEQEVAGEVGSGLVGHGPAYRDKKENLDLMEAELERDKTEGESRIALLEAERERFKKELSSLDQQMSENKEWNARQSNNLDGLVKRIELAHEISPEIGYALMLLFVMIEIAPILFKLMLREGAYDRILENLELLASVREGIDPAGQIVVDEKGQPSRRPAQFFQHEAELAVRMKRVGAERRLTEQAIDKYERDAALQLAPPPPVSNGSVVTRPPADSHEATTVRIPAPDEPAERT